MTIMDPIADMLTRVRNALARRYAEVVMPSSKMKIAVAEVLKSEGFISGFSVTETDGRLILTVSLKYAEATIGPAGIAIDLRLKGDDLEALKAASIELQDWI